MRDLSIELGCTTGIPNNPQIGIECTTFGNIEDQTIGMQRDVLLEFIQINGMNTNLELMTPNVIVEPDNSDNQSFIITNWRDPLLGNVIYTVIGHNNDTFVLRTEDLHSPKRETTVLMNCKNSSGQWIRPNIVEKFIRKNQTSVGLVNHFVGWLDLFSKGSSKTERQQLKAFLCRSYNKGLSYPIDTGDFSSSPFVDLLRVMDSKYHFRTSSPRLL